MKPSRIDFTAVKPGTKLIILHESTFQSWSKDTYTFGCMAGLAGFNHAYLGGPWPLDLVIVVGVLLKGLNSFCGYHVTVEQLRDMLAPPAPDRKGGEG